MRGDIYEECIELARRAVQEYDNGEGYGNQYAQTLIEINDKMNADHEYQVWMDS